MEVVGGLIDQFVEVRIRMFPVHAPIIRARNNLPKVADHGVDEKHLAEVIPIRTPGIGGPGRDDFKPAGHRVKPPDPGVHAGAAILGIPGMPDVAGRQDAMPPVKPAVGSPFQAIGDIVPDRPVIEPIQQHLRFAVGNIVVIAVRQKEQAGRAQHINAAKTDRHTGQLLRLIPKHRAPVKMPRMLRIFENNNAIMELQVKIQLLFRIGKILGNPQPTARVGRHGDGLLNVGLRRKHGGLESRREVHPFDGFLRRHQGRGANLMGVVNFGEIRCAGRRHGERSGTEQGGDEGAARQFHKSSRTGRSRTGPRQTKRNTVDRE